MLHPLADLQQRLSQLSGCAHVVRRQRPAEAYAGGTRAAVLVLQLPAGLCLHVRDADVCGAARRITANGRKTGGNGFDNGESAWVTFHGDSNEQRGSRQLRSPKVRNDTRTNAGHRRGLRDNQQPTGENKRTAHRLQATKQNDEQYQHRLLYHFFCLRTTTTSASYFGCPSFVRRFCFHLFLSPEPSVSAPWRCAGSAGTAATRGRRTRQPLPERSTGPRSGAFRLQARRVGGWGGMATPTKELARQHASSGAYKEDAKSQ